MGFCANEYLLSTNWPNIILITRIFENVFFIREAFIYPPKFVLTKYTTNFQF